MSTSSPEFEGIIAGFETGFEWFAPPEVSDNPFRDSVHERLADLGFQYGRISFFSVPAAEGGTRDIVLSEIQDVPGHNRRSLIRCVSAVNYRTAESHGKLIRDCIIDPEGKPDRRVALFENLVLVLPSGAWDLHACMPPFPYYDSERQSLSVMTGQQYEANIRYFGNYEFGNAADTEFFTGLQKVGPLWSEPIATLAQREVTAMPGPNYT